MTAQVVRLAATLTTKGGGLPCPLPSNVAASRTLSGSAPSLLSVVTATEVQPDTLEATPFTTLLLALREHDTRNQVTPCQMPGLDHLWTSDNHEEREAATHRCCSCPLLLACRNYAMTTEQHHVWAGVDLTRTTRKEKRP